MRGLNLALAAALCLSPITPAAAAPNTPTVKHAETPAGYAAWRARFEAAKKADDLKDALLSLTTIARLWPARLAEYSDAELFDVWSYSGDLVGGSAARNVMVEAWDDAGWAPSNPFWVSDYDYIRLQLIDGLLADGRPERARTVLSKLTTPRILLQVRVNARYDAIRQATPDITESLRLREAIFRQQIARRPELMEGAYALADNLYEQGRLDEARTILAEVVRRATAPNGKAAFVDGELLSWVYNRLADILYYQGRTEEALAAMKAGTAPSLRQADFLSLNLSLMYADLGRPREALADLPSKADPRTDVQIVIESIKADAYTQLRDTAKAAEALRYLEAHVEDGASWAIGTFLRAGRMDDAARVTIDRLQDPDHQTDMLLHLQDYALPDSAPPSETARHARLAALRQRPDVAAAIQAVGRIETVPITQTIPFK